MQSLRCRRSLFLIHSFIIAPPDFLDLSLSIDSLLFFFFFFSFLSRSSPPSSHSFSPSQPLVPHLQHSFFLLPFQLLQRLRPRFNLGRAERGSLPFAFLSLLLPPSNPSFPHPSHFLFFHQQLVVVFLQQTSSKGILRQPLRVHDRWVFVRRLTRTRELESSRRGRRAGFHQYRQL
ncbi:hypothetical protein BDY24DRAFT_56433 [Mrakia frigida]|uniref:uncharacterized protein n=1 Tax=Mrakia frigida TaxID=29902 RepID=UPI003FCC005F